MCNLNNTFDQINALISKNKKSKIPIKIIFMLKEVLYLHKNKYYDNRIDNYQILTKKIKDVENEQQPMFYPLAKNHHLHVCNKISVIYQ